LDDEILTHIKYVVEQKMKSKIKIEDLYKIAVFFDPRMKQLKILEQSDVTLIINQIKSQCTSLLNSDESDDSINTVQANPIKKRRKSKEITDFSQYYDSSSDDSNKNEVDQYMKSKVPKDKNLDILMWWRDHRFEFPKLALLCAYYLAIPASSASSEREFSVAGQTISERHTGLKPETVDSILVLYSALQ
jgi:hAT family C-terminal dimerisation region